MTLGLSALAALWLFASDHFGAPAVVGNLIAIVSAILWIVLIGSYTALGPFFATPVMTGLIHASFHAPEALVNTGRAPKGASGSRSKSTVQIKHAFDRL